MLFWMSVLDKSAAEGRLHMIEKYPGAHHLTLRRRQHTPDGKAAQVFLPGLDDQLD